jgi:hypothetical protein
MATAIIEIVDEGNDLVYVFTHEDDLQAALDESDGDVANFADIEWVESRPRTTND